MRPLSIRALALSASLLVGSTGFAFVQPGNPPLPNLDKRQKQSPQLAPAQAAALTELRAQVPNVTVDFEPVTAAPKSVSVRNGFLSGPGGLGKGISAGSLAGFAPADPNRVTKAFLQSHASLFGFGPEALDQARVSREHVTARNGLRTVVWEQQVDGIAVFEAVLISHTTKDGELVNLSSQFVPKAEAAAERGTPNRAALLAAPPLSALQAVALAAQNVRVELQAENVTALAAAANSSQRQKFKAPGLSGEGDAKLIWLPINQRTLRLCWDVVLTSRARGEMYRVLVDAQSGAALVRHCLTEYHTDASYRVFTSDSPSPFSPGHATPATAQPPLVSRELLTLSAADTNASPLGWISDGDNQTLGNNVDAHTDRNADDSPDLPRPQGSPSRVFDFPMTLTSQDPTNYSPAAVVQLFYLNNWMHDKLYELGFTEAAGNFQSDNFGRGGLGNDAVQADAQDGSGLNNANFSTPPDGSPGRMQMYIFSAPNPRRDGDLDAEVVLHEYTHGLSNRRVGGGVGMSALQSRGMGEGWSDFYPLALFSEADDDVNGNYAAGAYASHQLGGSGNLYSYYFGIRRYPFTTDMSKNPLTFNDIDPSQADYCSSGAPYHTTMFGTCSAGTASEVHNMGEVWCVALWDARANLINRYGWAGGNQLMLQLVTDGMSLSPPNPTFLQARDAILQADLVNNGGANRNELWAAFAKRGMGFGATSPASSTTAGVHESFDLPDDLSITPNASLISSGPVGGPFSPNSISFTLTNAGSSSFDWASVSPATWLDLAPASGTLTPGGEAVTVTASVNASANSLATGLYPATVWFTNLSSQVAQSRQFLLRIGQPDYFTELFDDSPNDLAFQSFTFTPDGSASFYSVCREATNNFPTDPTGGITVSLSDDSYAAVTLTGTNTVAIYSTRRSTFYIGSNGYLTLNSGDSEYSESADSHFDRPRVSAMFHDLYPPGGGTIYRQELSDRAVVTFQGISGIGTTLPNSFQIELFYDGRIRLTYLTVNCLYNMVGLSAGQSVPAGFLESDLSGIAPCTPPDFLQVGPGTGLVSQGYEGGPFTPSNTSYTLSNADTNSLDWSASASQPWATVDPLDGSLAPGTTTNVTVAINANAQSLSPDNYSATVTFSNLETGFQQTRNVSLLVAAIPGEIGVLDSILPNDDTNMPFGPVIVGLNRTEHITITNSDDTYGLVISGINLGNSFSGLSGAAASGAVERVGTALDVNPADLQKPFGQNAAKGTGPSSCAFRWENPLTTDARILVYADDYFHTAPNTYEDQALSLLGLSYTAYYNGAFTSFETALATGGPWDLVVFANDNDICPQSTLDALLAYVNADGRLIAHTWRMGTFSSHQLWSALGAVYVSDDTTPPDPVYWWEPTHALFTNPEQVPMFTALAAVGYGTYGQRLSLVAGNSAPAGYTTTATASAVAIVVAPSGQTILKGFLDAQNGADLDSDGKPDGVELWANLISSQLVPPGFQLAGLPDFPVTVAPGSSLTFDVIYAPQVVVTNTGVVTIESNDAETPQVKVLLSGQGIPDYLSVTPASDFDAQGPPGGPFTPASTSYVLSNTSPVAINWTASPTQSWVTVIPAGGTLAASESVSVLVNLSASANALTVGLWENSITFSNLTTGMLQQRAVALKIQPAFIALTNADVALLAESCGSGNGAIDPNETVTLELGLANMGNVPASNAVVTLLPTGGVNSPSGAQSYGTLLPGGPAVSNVFSFTATGTCGGMLAVTLQVQAGTSNFTVAFPFRLGVPDVVLSESFDTATAPELPSEWTVALSGAGSPWTTTALGKDTAPNAAFAPDPSSTCDNQLTSPSFLAPATGAQLSFRHAYSTESCCDAGWLQISIAGGAFTDILTAGGSFVTNGYPAGNGWRGTSTGYPAFITTIVNLPAAAQNQNVQLRWRFTADGSVSGMGWYVDTISVGGSYTCCVDPGIPTHFTWDPIASPQCASVPFNVTIRARNDADGIATKFTGVLALTAGDLLTTNTILAAPSLVYSVGGNPYTAGYSFAPSTNLTVTHVRHYFGTKVSIWTDAGTLVASRDVTSTGGTWLQTALATPVQLTAGTTYRVAAYSGGGTYYCRTDLGSNFPNGIIMQSYRSSGDAFPTVSDTARWWLVDLAYTALAGYPLTPTVSGNFVQGVWTGSLTVGQTASNVILRADDGVRPVAAANPIEVVGMPGIETERFGNMMLFIWPLWPVGSPAFTLESSTNLLPLSWVPIAQPPLQIEDSYVVPVYMFEPQRYYRLKLTGP
ncbi:MAG TPA: M36 family metallopeptidase [Candidatus Paceibacterota bacterium]|nr:M36 family metallopeptidase [Verrucomicrobiota bacterium]HSA10514.1 M36 family metallopeptidase [Candidatus Paceibacterota bacterium]